jgi:hypothetical protein
MSNGSEPESEHRCPAMVTFLADPDVPIEYWDKFREYGLRILDGGSAIQQIFYCPWCGAKLPPSLRQEWFDRLEELALEPNDDRVPAEMRSGEWWRRGLGNHERPSR